MLVSGSAVCALAVCLLPHVAAGVAASGEIALPPLRPSQPSRWLTMTLAGALGVWAFAPARDASSNRRQWLGELRQCSLKRRKGHLLCTP